MLTLINIQLYRTLLSTAMRELYTKYPPKDVYEMWENPQKASFYTMSNEVALSRMANAINTIKGQGYPQEEVEHLQHVLDIDLTAKEVADWVRGIELIAQVLNYVNAVKNGSIITQNTDIRASDFYLHIMRLTTQNMYLSDFFRYELSEKIPSLDVLFTSLFSEPMSMSIQYYQQLVQLLIRLDIQKVLIINPGSNYTPTLLRKFGFAGKILSVEQASVLHRTKHVWNPVHLVEDVPAFITNRHRFNSSWACIINQINDTPNLYDVVDSGVYGNRDYLRRISEQNMWAALQKGAFKYLHIRTNLEKTDNAYINTEFRSVFPESVTTDSAGNSFFKLTQSKPNYGSYTLVSSIADFGFPRISTQDNNDLALVGNSFNNLQLLFANDNIACSYNVRLINLKRRK